jgi:hypothetical protein
MPATIYTIKPPSPPAPDWLVIDVDVESRPLAIIGLVGAKMLAEGKSASEVAFAKSVILGAGNFWDVLCYCQHFTRVRFTRGGVPFEPIDEADGVRP